MIEVLQFIFQDFWHWAGTAILAGVVTAPVAACARGIIK